MDKLIMPEYYTALDYNQIKNEIRKVMESDLSTGEVKKRIVTLESQLLRRYR